MKCMEIFYDEKNRDNFIENLISDGYEEVETVTTTDEDSYETVYIVYYKPKPLNTMR